MLNNGETMVSVRMLPGSLAKLEALVKHYLEYSSAMFGRPRMTRSHVILMLIERDYAAVEELSRRAIEEQEAAKIKPKRARKVKVKS